MKRLICGFIVVLGLVPLAPARVIADAETSSVTGAGEGLFGGAATMAGVNLDGLQLGTGVFINPGGTATGAFHVVLLGSSLLGEPQEIAVDGKVSAGSVPAYGFATFSGAAMVNMGDGSVPILGVPFTVTASTGSLQLILGTTDLPPATLSAGSITIE
jgi:hypothetical protein